MHFMYVDESGDPGNSKYGSPHYILSGLIVSDQDWKECLARLKAFRVHIKNQTGLLIRTELHAAELVRVNKIQAYKSIPRRQRIAVINEFVRQMPAIFSNSAVINICLDKKCFPEGTNFQEVAWTRLIQRFDTYLKRTVSDKGIIIADEGFDPKARQILRKMRVYNPTLSHYGGTYNIPTDNILEDIFARNSSHSLFIQAVDFIAHVLYRYEYPKGSAKKYNLDKCFKDLEPILFKKASSNDPAKMGIVRK